MYPPYEAGLTIMRPVQRLNRTAKLDKFQPNDNNRYDFCVRTLAVTTKLPLNVPVQCVYFVKIVGSRVAKAQYMSCTPCI